VVLGFGLGSRVLGKGSTPFTRALYPPGGEHLGVHPSVPTHLAGVAVASLSSGMYTISSIDFTKN
jgi:hypothetical protein